MNIKQIFEKKEIIKRLTTEWGFNNSKLSRDPTRSKEASSLILLVENHRGLSSKQLANTSSRMQNLEIELTFQLGCHVLVTDKDKLNPDIKQLVLNQATLLEDPQLVEKNEDVNFEDVNGQKYFEDQCITEKDLKHFHDSKLAISEQYKKILSDQTIFNPTESRKDSSSEKREECIKEILAVIKTDGVLYRKIKNDPSLLIDTANELSNNSPTIECK